MVGMPPAYQPFKPNKLKTMNQPTRVSLVVTPHKGIRNFLSQLSLQAGATDYADADVVAVGGDAEGDLAGPLGVLLEGFDPDEFADLCVAKH